ncbi:MAG TPA: hypothetical protein VJC06_01195 [Candidatus Paceibacterota bacterium]
MVASLNAQEKKRVLRPISFKVMNVEPTTFITYEPFKVSYRLEYLGPRKGKEVRILDNLDKNHFQSALGTPVDVDLRELRKKYGDKVNQLKIDSGPKIIVSDLQTIQEKVVGDRIRRDFVVTLKLIRETTTVAPILMIRLEIPEVPVLWAVAELGQKEGEYQHEKPEKSGKVMVNHVLTTPTHDPSLNFRSKITVPGYSFSSISWFFWGVPVISFLLVGGLCLVLVWLYKQPVLTVEDQLTSTVGSKKSETVSGGIKRIKFNYARANLWEAAVAADQGLTSKNSEVWNKLLEGLYRSLNDLLLAGLPTASVGSLPSDFVRILGENTRRSKMENILYALAGLANSLKPFYEAMNSGGSIVKDTEDGLRNQYDRLVKEIKAETLKLWWYNRRIIFRGK